MRTEILLTVNYALNPRAYVLAGYEEIELPG